jgi:hypothetical protein
MVVRRHRGSAAGSGASIPDTKESLILSPDGTPAITSSSGIEKTVEPKSEYGEFADLVRKDLEALGAPKTEVKEAVLKLTKLYAKDKGNAEKEFRVLHASFEAARDAEKIMSGVDEELGQISLLSDLARKAEGMNVAKARIIATLGSKIPGVKLIAGAIGRLGELELELKGLGLSEDQGIFTVIANCIRGADNQLKDRGIVITGDEAKKVIGAVRERANGVFEHEAVAGFTSSLTNLAKSIGFSPSGLFNGVVRKTTGFDVEGVTSDLRELTATGGSTPKGRGERGGRK